MRLRTPKLSRSLRVILYSMGCVGFLFLAWNVVLPYLISLTPFGMRDELHQTATSPDGRYTAKLLYNDGLTFGYGHITLETSGWHPFGYGRTDLVEVASGGLMDVSWQDTRTLIVEYDATKNKDPNSDTYFVTQPKAWRDIKIVYHPSK